MKPLLPLCLCFLLGLLSPVHAASERVPDVVARGFERLEREGIRPALNAWVENTPRAYDDVWQDEAAAQLEAAQSRYGQVLGYEAIRTVVLSASTQRVYVVLRFERGVLWMLFDCYSPRDQWLVTRISLDRNPAMVLPPGILSGQ